MSEVFGTRYAAAYDALYGEKDYEAECELTLELAGRYGAGEVRRVLDLGAGTGGHAIPLARRGLEVVGVDRSAEMIERARRKARTARVDVRFEVADIRTAEVAGSFDLVLMMFAVLGYLGSDDGVLAGLATARRHLLDGGIFVFDVWYGPAVLAQRPSERTLDVAVDGGTLHRRSSGTLDEAHRLCIVDFEVADERDGTTTRERHEMRYFGRDDLERLCTGAGLELVHLSGFPELEREPDESTWSVIAAARAV